MASLAFLLPVAPLPLKSLHRTQNPFSFRPAPRRHLHLACTSLPDQKPVPADPTFPSTPQLPSINIPPAATTGAQALLDDVSERPQYYLNVSGVILGLILSVIVLSATMLALDQLPLVPDALRMVGLTYLFWFLGKFLLNGGERQRLQDEIDEFVAIVRGDTMPALQGRGGADAGQIEAVRDDVDLGAK